MTKRRTRRDGAPVPSEEPWLRLREPADVLSAIPYLMGYHPTDSVVVLGLRGKSVVFTARNDLPVADAPRRHVRAAIDYLLSVLLRQQVTAILIVGFGPEDRVTRVALGLRSACTRAGLTVLEVLRAADKRYWSYLCADPACCPPEGSPFDPTASSVSAEWTVAGKVALPDRESYESQLKPIAGTSRILMTQATGRADRRLLDLITESADEHDAKAVLMDAGRRAIADAEARQRSGVTLDDDEVAWLTVLLSSIDIRDLAWVRIKGSVDDLDLYRTLWMDVMRRAEPDLIPAPACLYAFAAWRCGEGALARLALEQALHEDPDYAMAGLLFSILARGLPPSVLNNNDPGPAIRRKPAPRRRRRSSSRRAGSRRG